jgi:hypothetical protein
MMADYQAISAVCEAIMRRLRAAYRPELFSPQRLEFKVCSTPELISRSRTVRPGVTLYLYDVRQAAARRNIPPPRTNGGRLELPPLQVELRFLLTAWARGAGAQQATCGWMMRLMEDQPVLPAAVLNNVTPAAFHPDETVEIVLDGLSSLEVLQVWEKSVRSPYQLSVPYIARNITIETLQPAQNPNDPG